MEPNLTSTSKVIDDDCLSQATETVAEGNSLRWKPLLSLALAGLGAEIPFFVRGTAYGHDFRFHLYSWLEVLSQWMQGIVYPRWASLSNFGYGEPRFVFYPPASWALGATLSAIFPWTLVADIYIWIALVAAGIAMFLLARRFLNRRDATFAAVLYAVNPYQLVIVYWRSAFAELLGSFLPPLLLLLLLRIEKGKRTDEVKCDRRLVVLLAMLLASSWLINAPAAVLIHYSLALLMVTVAWQRRSPRILMSGGAAVLLGAALAAFYLFPAIYEQKWVEIGRAVYAGGESRPLDNFLFAHTSDANHDAFNRAVSWIAVAEIGITFAAAYAARSWSSRNRELWTLLVIWAGACALLVLPISNPLWNILPKLRFMQYPWRWLLGLGVSFSLLVTMSLKKSVSRAAFCFVMLCLLVVVRHYFQRPWWASTTVLHEVQNDVATSRGYKGTDEYTPLAANIPSVDRNAPRVMVNGSAHAAIGISEWSAERKVFTAEMSAPDHLVLHLFNYPAWRVEVNGQQVQPGNRDRTGQVSIPVEAGTNLVQVIFVRTWDRTAGAWISALSLLLCVLPCVGLLRSRSSRLAD